MTHSMPLFLYFSFTPHFGFLTAPRAVAWMQVLPVDDSFLLMIPYRGFLSVTSQNSFFLQHRLFGFPPNFFLQSPLYMLTSRHHPVSCNRIVPHPGRQSSTTCPVRCHDLTLHPRLVFSLFFLFLSFFLVVVLLFIQCVHFDYCEFSEVMKQ